MRWLVGPRGCGRGWTGVREERKWRWPDSALKKDVRRREKAVAGEEPGGEGRRVFI